MPVVIVEDDDGDCIDGGPFRIAMSVASAKVLVCSLVDAIQEQEERHPELADEMAVEEFDSDCVEEDDEDGNECDA